MKWLAPSKISNDFLRRDFSTGSVFDFFNTIGTKRLAERARTSVFGGKADMGPPPVDFRFGPQAVMSNELFVCRTSSGLPELAIAASHRG